MRVNAGAKSYARALFELAEERHLVPAVVEEIKYFTEILKSNPTLRKVLSAAQIAKQKKKEILGDISLKVGVSPLLSHYLLLLAEKNRLAWLDQIQIQFQLLVDESNGVLRGTVATAEAMTEEQVRDLERAFGKKFGRTILLAAQEDKTLLGGLVVQIRDLTFDGSLKTSLNHLKNTLERQYV